MNDELREKLVRAGAYMVKRNEISREPDSIESSHIYMSALVVDAILAEIQGKVIVDAEQWEAAVEANTLFDLCWHALETAIANEDGLDGKVGHDLMKEIRKLQSRLPPPDKLKAAEEKP